jgi:hypothetical protein
MSSLGQLSARLDRNLSLVGNLTKALLALRAELTGKLGALKLSAEDTSKAREFIQEFLTHLVPALNGKAETQIEDFRAVCSKLVEAGEQPLDWAEDFQTMIDALHAGKNLEAEQLDKITRIVGFLQGEAAEDVRRLRSR